MSGADFHTRGRDLDRQLEELHNLWKPDSPVGPPVEPRPTLLIGGTSEAAFRRAARYADGWTMGGGDASGFAEPRERLREAWAAAGRTDEPKTMALFYPALGDDAKAIAREKLGDYYAWLGPYADQIAEGAAKDADTIKQIVAGFDEAGLDEVIAFPASPDPAQVDFLADALR